MVFAAMLPWSLFSNALSESSNSLIGNANLISKVYFPRMIVPAATIITALVDFLISFVILIFLMIFYQFLPGWQILLLPFYHPCIACESGAGVMDHRIECEIS